MSDMNHLTPYIPIAMILVFAVGFGSVTIIMGRIFGPQRPNINKSMAYESGIEPTGEANVRIPIKFYMVGILFLLFDIESIFVLAWAVIFQGNGLDFSTLGFTRSEFRAFAFAEMMVFFLILMVGYAYIWRKGGFRWS